MRIKLCMQWNRKGGAMLQTIWMFRVKHNRRDEFEKRYRSSGDGAQSFALAEGYRGTALLRQCGREDCYATVDCWDSIEALEIFKVQFEKEYRELDAICGTLIEREEHVDSLSCASNRAARPFRERNLSRGNRSTNSGCWPISIANSSHCL